MATETKRVYDIQVNGTDSFNELKKAIEQLNEKLKTLNQTSQEYKDTLKQLAELQSQLAETMTTAKDVLDAFGETGSDVVESFLTGFVEGLEEAASATTEVNTSTIELDDSLTKEASSLKELKEQINGLKDRLVQLNVNSKEYKETVEILVEKNQKLQSILSTTKREVNSVAGSYNALSQEMAALRKRWKETSDEAERAQIGKRIAEINTELKKMDASIGNYQRNVGNYAGAIREVFTDPRKEIRALRLELAQLEEGTDEYNAALRRLADITMQQRKLNEQLKFSSTDLEDIFGNLAGTASGIVGGFSALNAAMGLFESQNTDLQKAMLKTQQMMALVQGLNGLAGLKDKFVGLIDGIKGYVSRFGILNKSTKEFTEQTKAAGGAATKTTSSLQNEAGVTSNLAMETEKLVNVTKNFTDSQMAEYQALEDRKVEISTQISLIEELIRQMNLEAGEIEGTNEERAKELDIIEGLIKKREQELEILREEYELIESTQQQKRTEALKEVNDETEKSVYALQEKVDATKKDIEAMEEDLLMKKASISASNAIISNDEKEIAEIKKKAQAGEKLSEEEMERISALESSIERQREQIRTTEDEVKALEKEIALKKQEVTSTEQEIQQSKKLVALRQKEKAELTRLGSEYTKLGKFQVLSRLEKRLEIAETKRLIEAEEKDIAEKKLQAQEYIALGVAAKVGVTAIKGVKAALVSTGLGAILVAIGWALGKIGDKLSSFWDWATGVKKAREEFERMSKATASQLEYTERMVSYWKAQGLTDLEIAKKKYTELKQAAVDALFEYEQAVIMLGEDSEEAAKGYEDWLNVQKEIRDYVNENIDYIETFLTEVEKADRQKGMSQLDIDLENINNKFQTAIDLVKQFQLENKIGASMAQEYLERLNKDWDLAIKQAQEKAASATTSTTKTGKSEYEKQKEEAEKLYKELVEANKREEQKLKEKYEKEKKLLEKFHKDTTLLTKKYYEDLDKLLTERQKVEYDKWVAHLNSMLVLQRQNSIEYYEMQIENMKKIFSADFGADNESPFEQLFNIQILDEWGSKAISITDDIRESMKMMGLDPNNIDDIQTMIDKWEADKKAIEDAEKALAKFKSELKFNEFKQEGDALEGYMEAMLNNIDFMSEKIQSQSLWKGFYSGLSPEQEKADFEARYAIIEEELNKELELWQTAMNDETLSAEDRNKAIQKYNQTMAKVNSYAVQKEIDANNLLIKSFQRVTDAISSMSTNLANILGSVSDMIMDTAQAQLDAGEITSEEYERQFNKAKGIQIAQATINTIAGAVGAFMGITRDTGGWGIAAAAIEAAAVLAAGFAQIAQIRNTKVDSNGGGGGGGDSTTFQLPSVMVPEPTRVQNTTNQDDIDQLKNALGDQKVYVVESDISAALGTSNKRQAEVTF